MVEAALRASGLDAAYQYNLVVRSVDLEVGHNEVVCLLGPNGAGKTSTLRAISGLMPKTSGDAFLGSHKLNRIPAHERVRLGLGHVPERAQVFDEMTVQENLEVACYARTDWRKGSAEQYDLVFGLFPKLNERLRQVAGTLSGGERQMLAIGRCLMTSPKVLLLDEPSLGLAPVAVSDLYEALTRLSGLEMGVLIVEQLTENALALASRGYVVYQGAIVDQDSSENLAASTFLASGYTDVRDLKAPATEANALVTGDDVLFPDV